jgi:hypothetical protein
MGVVTYNEKALLLFINHVVIQMDYSILILKPLEEINLPLVSRNSTRIRAVQTDLLEGKGFAVLGHHSINFCATALATSF